MRNKQRNPILKYIKCSCGANAKRVSKRNFPFGVNSKSKKSVYYACPICKKRSMAPKENERFQSRRS